MPRPGKKGLVRLAVSLAVDGPCWVCSQSEACNDMQEGMQEKKGEKGKDGGRDGG